MTGVGASVGFSESLASNEHILQHESVDLNQCSSRMGVLGVAQVGGEDRQSHPNHSFLRLRSWARLFY